MAVAESVTSTWVICIARGDASALATLRLTNGIEIAEATSDIWLRGQRADETLDAKLAALPGRERYELLPGNQLRLQGHRVPSARLPNLQWRPLGDWLRIELPVAALPANEPTPIPLRLVRSADERTPELLLTSLAEFTRFSAQAAQIRLGRLQFAASADGRVLVRGTPLPPLPGQRFVLSNGVAVPAGFAWQPAVSAEVLARRFGVSGDGLVLWNDDGTITRFHVEQFVSATRSAVRATGQAVAEST
jgi:hypothetical protein